jgi:hypothetical protein
VQKQTRQLRKLRDFCRNFGENIRGNVEDAQIGEEDDVGRERSERVVVEMENGERWELVKGRREGREALVADVPHATRGASSGVDLVQQLLEFHFLQ